MFSGNIFRCDRYLVSDSSDARRKACSLPAQCPWLSSFNQNWMCWQTPLCYISLKWFSRYQKLLHADRSTDRLNKANGHLSLFMFQKQNWYTKYHFLWLAETKCANSYVNWGAEHKNHNKNASSAMVFELSSLTCTTSLSRRMHIALVHLGLLRLPTEHWIWRIMHQGPAIISKHLWVPFPFVSALHCCNVLVETFTVLVTHRTTGKKSKWELRKWIFMDILHPSFWCEDRSSSTRSL